MRLAAAAPLLLSPSPTARAAAYGDYFNGEPGRPLLVSLLLYLNDEWRREWGADTLFLDGQTDTGAQGWMRVYVSTCMDKCGGGWVGGPNEAVWTKARASRTRRAGCYPDARVQPRGTPPATTAASRPRLSPGFAAPSAGIFVAPRPGRAVLFDQDIMHRVSAPSRASPALRSPARTPSSGFRACGAQCSRAGQVFALPGGARLH